jgi:hypothetical protein
MSHTNVSGDAPSGRTVDSHTSLFVKLRAWLFLICMVVMLVWSCRAFWDYGELFAKLSGKPLLERGYIGSDEWQNFLARVGRLQTQERYRQAQEMGVRLPSQIGAGWQFFVQTVSDGQLPPDAKVFLATPDILLYYYGTSLWFPRELHVNTQPVMIRDGETLVKNSLRLDVSQLPRLKQLGYTHLLAPTPQGIRLIPLAAVEGGRPR